MSDGTWAVWTFWIAVAGVFYPYAGYPVVLLLVRRLSSTPRHSGATELPTVSMIIPVHNEAARLERKIANTLALDYPADRMEVFFVSDGSTDDTVSLISSKVNPRLTLIEPGRAARQSCGTERWSRPRLW